MIYHERFDTEECEDVDRSTCTSRVTAKKDEEAFETAEGEAMKEWDYVFFDWKGTLARQSGMNTEQRTTVRLQRFYEELKELLLRDNSAHSEDGPHQTATSSLPSFDVVQQAYEQAKRNVEEKRQKANSFSWAEVVDEILAQLHLSAISDKERHQLAMSFQVGGHHDSGIYEGAADLLTWLKTEKKMNIGLIRNSKVTEAAMRHRISKVGLDDSLFDTVVMSGEIGFAKPDPEVFLSAVNFANLRSLHDRNPKRILYIGNEVQADVVGANGVGWTSVLVRHTENSSSGLADYEVDNLLQMKDIFNGNRRTTNSS